MTWAWNAPLALLHIPAVRSGLGLTLAAALVVWLALHDPAALFGCWLAGTLPLVGHWCVGPEPGP